MTFGTHAIKNSASSCDDGAVTLLSPGSGGLSTEQFSPAADLAFGPHGDAVGATISRPVRFGHRRLAIVTSARNLQDAPRGAAEFVLPRLYLIGDRVNADLRSVQILYNGLDGSTCSSASGFGCWLVGAERATGSYNGRTHALSLTWFSGQSFTAASAGTEIHLVGTFHGSPKSVEPGTTVDLGTASFAAGTTSTAVETSAGHQHAAGRSNAERRPQRGSATSLRRSVVRADSDKTTTGSPSTFLIGELVAAANIVAYFSLARRRRRR